MAVAESLGTDELAQRVADLLTANALGARGCALEPLRTGGNNRVFRTRAGGRELVVKHYYGSAHDERDRLAAEWAFLCYAETLGLDCVPRPVCRDAAARIGVYEFVDGRAIEPAAVDGALVAQAAGFVARLNGSAHGTAAAALPEASEACFNIAAQLALVARRVARLGAIEAADAESAAAVDLATAIARRHRDIAPAIEAAVATEPTRYAEPLAAADRCVSPSDFGFHNALLDGQGRVVFLDFEYAGWDDPAKMAADFFSHPGVPVDHVYLEDFMRIAFGHSPRAAQLAVRTRLFMPLLKLKWCCIMLNEFLPDAARRRAFANPAARTSVWRQRQVDKVDRYLELLET